VVDKANLTAKKLVSPIDLTEGIKCPIMGLFGNENPNPNVEQVNQTEAALKRYGKIYEFHRYDGAGHAFFAHYRRNNGSSRQSTARTRSSPSSART